MTRSLPSYLHPHPLLCLFTRNERTSSTDGFFGPKKILFGIVHPAATVTVIVITVGYVISYYQKATTTNSTV